MTGCVLLIAAVGFALSDNREPSYGGKSLSQWAAIYTGRAFSSRDERAAAAQAIREIGTNSLPFILEWIGYQPSPLKQAFYTFIGDLPNWITHNKAAAALITHDAKARANSAPLLFGALRELGAPAIPDLVRVIGACSSDVRGYRAMDSLTRIGPAAAPALIRLLVDGSSPIDSYANYYVRALGTNADLLGPVLVQRLTHTNETVVISCARALGELKYDPEMEVPRLTMCLKDTRTRVRVVAADVLGRYGDSARTAIPALREVLSDSDPRVRTAAAKALSHFQ